MWNFLKKLLEGDELILGLLDESNLKSKIYYPNGIENEKRLPKYIKADMYHYKLVSPFSSSKNWWTREFEESLIKPLTLDSRELQRMVRQYAR